MNKRFKSITLILCATFCFAVAGFAANAPDQAATDEKAERRGLGDWLNVMNRLNLDEKQRLAMMDLVQKHIIKQEPFMQRMFEAQRALRAASTQEPLDEKLVRRRADDLGSVITDIAVESARLRADIVALLNEDQKKTFYAMEKQIDRVEVVVAQVTEFVRFLNRMFQIGRQIK